MRYLMAVYLLLTTCAFALGHGAAQWIQDGQYRNAIGDLCCGEHDCAQLATEDVSVTAGGYLIKSLHETVPFEEATPSPDGKYWRCFWGGKRKCFFAPPTST
ncbi:MAG TPA: hypothetical protein VNR11_02380 [Xanthobacteraceae bacterium]|nr:hypothetical protein [Xanthobacteraceae bacterium]